MEQPPANDLPNGADAAPPQETPGFWHELIPEREAGRFLGLTDRFMQNRRVQGDGPRYVAVSSRCIRYRRHDLKAWADARVKTSTSDPGREAA